MQHSIVDRPSSAQFERRSLVDRRRPQLSAAAAFDHLGQVRSVRSHAIDAIEAERRRLARDLHDEAGHRLTAVMLSLDAVIQEYSRDSALGASLESTRQLVRECAAGLHEIAFDLRPSLLSDLGLVPAISALLRRLEEAAGSATQFQVKGDPRRLAERIELAAFRIVQEALTNATKYAASTSINVRINFLCERVEISISDNGVGFDIGEMHGDRPRFGLTGMRERVDLIGGEMHIHSNPGLGTTVRISLPSTEVGV